ncbi:MAG TPA: hypothetical protein VH115_08865 [Solirubrobacteraceae bacterium]|nr:hypothetical protein [Solirubrobacteraceae bacterium]
MITAMRKLAALSALATAILGVAAVASGSQSGSAKCPLKPSSSLPGGEAWAFTVTGVPASAHAGISSSYAHGRGTWTHGHGAGTVCRADTPASGPPRDVVLKIGGSAHVSPGVTELGRRGVSLALSVTVSASDSQACAVGTRGSVTIFASYYQGHHDRVQLRFASACAAEDATFLGQQLHALIAREGHQVNHA